MTPMPHSGWAAASASSTTGSNQPSSKPVAARAAGCSSPGPARSAPHAAGASPDPATSARRPAAPRHAPGLSATTPELSAPPDTLTSPDPLTRLFQHSTDPHHKQKHPNTRLQERQYECTVPTVADRVVQASLKSVLEPIFEADFQPCSYGFRPNRRTHDAIAEIHHLASAPRNYHWALECDIRACFDEIGHAALVDRLRVRIKDKRVLALVKAFLKSGVLTELGDREESLTGTPQGGLCEASHKEP